MKTLTVVLVCLCALASPVLADIISLQPSLLNTTVGSPFTLDVNITGGTDLYAYQFELTFDPTILFAVSVSNGLFLSSLSDGSFIPGTIDNVGGLISATADSETGLVSGVTGSGRLASFQFTAIGSGTSAITVPVSGVILLDSNLDNIAFTTSGGSVNVSGVTSVPEPASSVLMLSGVMVLLLFRSSASQWKMCHCTRSDCAVVSVPSVRLVSSSSQGWGIASSVTP